MEKDRRGRRRQPNQERGLRPLHPLLPEQWTSRVLRVAMSQEDWARFEALVRSVAPQAPTLARAHGMAIFPLIDQADTPCPAPDPLDWMDWERQKILQLMSGNWWSSPFRPGAVRRKSLNIKIIRSLDSRDHGCSTSCPT
jgi:hypothetical protein